LQLKNKNYWRVLRTIANIFNPSALETLSPFTLDTLALGLSTDFPFLANELPPQAISSSSMLMIMSFNSRFSMSLNLNLNLLLGQV
jgi:hypothetical protein